MQSPIGCGRNTPLIGNRDWPKEWRTEVNKWGAEMLPAVQAEPIRDAEQLMADTLAAATAPITVIAVGPLTNLGVVLVSQPELANRIERIVIMGGAVTVPGNVEKSPAAEWNIYIDPEAARRVIAAGIAVTLVPLDATNHVPWTERVLRRLATLEAPAAHTVYQMASSRTALAGFYFWDELAAMAAIETNLVTLESMTGTYTRQTATAFVNAFVQAIATLASNVLDLTPPPALSAAHANYAKILHQFVDGKDELLVALAKAQGADPTGLIADATAQSSLGDIFDRIRNSCQVLEDYSFLHDGPRPCSSAADQ